MRQIHGQLSLMLIGLAVSIGLAGSFDGPLWLPLLYFGVIVCSTLVTVFLYCGKCECGKTACAHILPGKLAQRLPPRPDTAYSIADLGGTGVALALLFGVPLLWLWRSPVLAWTYGLLLIVGMVEIQLFVCKGCQNRKCPMGRRRNPFDAGAKQ